MFIYTQMLTMVEHTNDLALIVLILASYGNLMILTEANNTLNTEMLVVMSLRIFTYFAKSSKWSTISH